MEILPGIALGVCPLPLGWNLAVAVVLACGERLAVIDTGVAEFMPQAITPALATVNRNLAQVDLIFNTHSHWDHVQGNAAIKAASSAQVCIPALDAPDLETGANFVVNDGAVVDLGAGLRFEVIFTPGHSRGMSCLYERSLRLLIVSDAAQGFGPEGAGMPLYYHSGAQYRASLDRLAALEVETLVLGHPFRWSGPSRFVHRGADAHRFLADSQAAAAKVATIARQALAECPDRHIDCLRRAALPQLMADPRFGILSKYGLSRLVDGTLQSEMDDLGA